LNKCISTNVVPHLGFAHNRLRLIFVGSGLSITHTRKNWPEANSLA